MKNISGGNKPGPEHIKHLAGFVGEMFDNLHTISADASGNENSDGDECIAVSAVKTILDFKSPPNAVIEAQKVFTKESEQHQHWLVQAMCLDRGRKVVEAAMANAKSREQQSGVLGLISDGIEKMDKADLMSEESVVKSGAKAFTNEYGNELVKLAKVLQDPGNLEGSLG